MRLFYNIIKSRHGGRRSKNYKFIFLIFLFNPNNYHLLITIFKISLWIISFTSIFVWLILTCTFVCNCCWSIDFPNGKMQRKNKSSRLAHFKHFLLQIKWQNFEALKHHSSAFTEWIRMKFESYTRKNIFNKVHPKNLESVS